MIPRPFQSSSAIGSGDLVPVNVKRSFKSSNRVPSAATAFNRYLHRRIIGAVADEDEIEQPRRIVDKIRNYASA